MPILSVGGASKLMSEIIPRINTMAEYEVDFLISKCINPTFLPVFEKAGIRLYILSNSRIYSPMNIFKIRKYLKKYDLIHAHLFPTLYWVALANVFANKPIVYTEHSTYNSRRGKWYLRPIEKFVYGRYKKIISISDKTQSNLLQWIDAKQSDRRFVVINNGVNIEIFRNCKRERIYPHTLIMVARFVAAKDHETVIRAMALLDADVHLIFVGDGDTMKRCKILAHELNVDERIHFVGTQSNVPMWIGRADVGIQSSHWEGFGLTAVEMMAAGLPVVASNVEGLNQVVDGAGELFPCGDYESLANIINHLLTSKEYYKEISERCKVRSDKYDLRMMIRGYIDVYNEIQEIQKKLNNK